MGRYPDGSACEAFAHSWREDGVAHARAPELPCASRLRARLTRAPIARGVFRLVAEAGRPGAYRFADVGADVPRVLPFARDGARLDRAYDWLDRRDADRLLRGVIDARAARAPVRVAGALALGQIRDRFEVVLGPALADAETIEFWGAVDAGTGGGTAENSAATRA